MNSKRNQESGSAARLNELTSKITRGERLTNVERSERQGIIFNHSGKCGQIITGFRPLKPDTANLKPVTPTNK